MSSRYSRTAAAITLGVFISFGLLSSWLRQTIAQTSEKEILPTQQLQSVPPVVSGIENSHTQTLTVYVEPTAQPNFLPLVPIPLAFNKRADMGSSPIINVPLDIVLLQDETSSMRDDIGNMNHLSPEIWDSISTIAHAGFRMSVIGFRDFDRHPWGNSGDWVFRRYQDFTVSRTVFTEALGQLTALGGNDVPESQYAALYYLLSASHGCIDSNGDRDCIDINDTPAGQQPSFRSGARRIILLATDAPFHDPETTTNYPGPSKNAVVSVLQDNRAILIGLVPGGAGKISEIDELASLTGGSVQNTGGTGADVANAIATALASIRPVSAALSTIESLTDSIPADGSVASITVTLRDTAGNPVSGKTILLRSNHPGDWFIQPDFATDAQGRATGFISSITVGFSTISAIDVTDNVQILQSVTLNFTEQTVPPNENLQRRIDMLNRYSKNDLDRLASIARDAGLEGDKFLTDIGVDAAQLVMDVLFGVMGVAEAKRATAPTSVRYMYPGVEESGWNGILSLKQKYPKGGKLFNSYLQKGFQTGEWNGLTLTILQGGLKFYAAAFRDEAVEEISTTVLVESMRKLVSFSNGLSIEGQDAADGIAELQLGMQDEHDNLLAGIPPMSDSQQNAYADDLARRTLVPMVLTNVQEHQANLLKNLRAAHDSVGTGGWQYFVLKFIASNLAFAGFDGHGKVLVDGFTSTFETYLDYRKLKAAGRAYFEAPIILKGSAEAAATIYSNSVSGFRRISKQLPPQPITGQISNVNQVSQGEYWGFIVWNEKTSYVEFDLTNTTSEYVNFMVIVEYGYNSELFGLPWAYIPLVKHEIFNFSPNETQNVRVYFLQEEKGGSPEKDTRIRIDVLATNRTGEFFIDSDDRSWNPQRITTLGIRASTSGALADVPVIENPIGVYIFNDRENQSYEAQIWVSNPFSQPITIDVTQPLPTELKVSAASSDVTDSNLRWTQTIQARDIISLPFEFQYSGTPGVHVSLPSAVMSFVEPTSGITLVTNSNSPDFVIQQPVHLEGYAPSHVYGATSSFLITVTNDLSAVTNGQVLINIIDVDETILYGEVRTFYNEAKASESLAFTLPSTILPGSYDLLVWLVLSGNKSLAMRDALVVQGISSQSGDCNGDQTISATDVTALALEFFDGDDNSNPLGAAEGSYPGSPACDANEDNRIGASDVACIARIFFNGPGTCRAAVNAADALKPSLSIPTQIPAVAGDQVTVPLVLNRNADNVGSLLFSLDYDETWLHFDPADHDGNGMPDAIAFNLPAEFVTTVAFDPADTVGELDFTLANFAATPVALPNGALATVTLTAGQPPTATIAAIGFAQTPAASFGHPVGSEVSGTTVAGSVLIAAQPANPLLNHASYLPLINAGQ